MKELHRIKKENTNRPALPHLVSSSTPPLSTTFFPTPNLHELTPDPTSRGEKQAGVVRVDLGGWRAERARSGDGARGGADRRFLALYPTLQMLESFSLQGYTQFFFL
jgi:hypothetical protein